MTLRFLLLEDSPLDAELMQACLSEGGIDCDCVRVETESDFEAALSQPFDMILADYALPQFDGITALSIARTRCPETPFIFVSATLGEELAIEALKSGATDYVLKQRLGRLVPSVERALREAQERRDRQFAQAALQQYKDLFHHAGLGLVIGNVNSITLGLVNPAFARMHGYTVEELVGQPILDLFAPDCRDQALRAIEIAIDRGHYSLESKHLRRDGSVFPVLIDMTVVRDDDGSIRYRIANVTDITDRKQAEIALQQSETEFRLLANAMPQIVWTCNAQGELDFVSQQWYDYTQFTPQQTYDRQILPTVIHPDDRPGNEAAWQVAIAAASLYQSEYRLKRAADQTYRWFLGRALPIKNEQGQVLRWYGTSTDIDDRKRAEEALRASESQFRLMVESATEYAIFTMNLDGIVTKWNSGAQRVLGYTEAEIVGQSGRVIFTPEDLAIDRPAQEQHLALSEGRAENERWHRRKDNSRFWASGLLMPLRDEADQVQGFLTILRDMTEPRQAEAALRQSEERLRQALEAARMVAWEWSAETDRVIYSPTAIEVFGMPESQQIKTSREALALIHPDDLLTHRAIVRDSAASGGSYVSQFRVIRPDNQAIVWLEDRGSVLADPNGKPVKISGILIDITQRVQLEAERDRILKREQAAREEAEAANRVKDEFLAVLSHELRTPLNPILGWTKLLRTRKFDAAKTDQALETIERNAQLQTQLIEDLLDVSRILQGKLSLKADAVDLSKTIAAAIETVRLAAEAKSIEIYQEVAPVFVAGDADRLQQVLWNLLSNAIKFTPPGGRVTVQLESCEFTLWEVQSPTILNVELTDSAQNIPYGNAPRTKLKTQNSLNSFAQITVTDTGKGISATFLPHVFEYFRQADSSTTRQFGGLGLGLAIVRRLVELHGGTVAVSSRGEGQGTTFTVQLPLGKQDEERRSAGRHLAEFISSDAISADAELAARPVSAVDSQQMPLAVNSPQPVLSDRRILVVDDEADTRDYLAFLLGQHGAIVTTAASAGEALEVIRASTPKGLARSQPDLILSDIGMPQIDGYMLIQQIRGLEPEQGGEMPAIALTAYAGELNQRRAQEAGFQMHLAKPVMPEHLIATIVQVLDQANSGLA